MKERPILMNGAMVRATLREVDPKTQTRRAIKLNAAGRAQLGRRNWHLGDPDAVNACPYGQTGDRLWVREKHCFIDIVKSALSQFPLMGGEFGPDVWNLNVEYSDGTEHEISVEGERPKQTRERGEIKWRPSIHMPRWASRILLEIVSVRVERLQDISEADALEEGITYNDIPNNGLDPMRARTWYRGLWESINGPGSWDANPWVWVIEFKRVIP